VSGNIKYSILGNEISDPLKAANLDFSKDFDPNSQNTDRTKKDRKELESLALFSDEELTALQHTDLVSLSHEIDSYGFLLRDNLDDIEYYQSLLEPGNEDQLKEFYTDTYAPDIYD